MDILDEYNGHAEPGGAAIRRTLLELSIAKISVGPYDNNAYLLVCRQRNEALLIDAAAEAGRLSELIDRHIPRPTLRAIATTHQHSDHWQALDAMSRDVDVIAHPADATALPIPSTTLVNHGDTVRVGACALDVIHLRGHTPGSIALLYRDPHGPPHLFTGDSLFPGGVGKTSSPAEFKSLIDDVENRIFAVLPDETWVYPGHGDDTALGVERPRLGEWRARGW